MTLLKACDFCWSFTSLEFGLFSWGLVVGRALVFDNLYSYLRVFWPVVFDKLLAFEVLAELMAAWAI